MRSKALRERWADPGERALATARARPGSGDNEPHTNVYGGLIKGDSSHGWTINFTQSALVAVEDRDPDSGNDALIADHLMCGGWAAPSGFDKQTYRIIQLRESLLDDPDRFLTRTYDFADEDCSREDRSFTYELHLAISRSP